MSVFVWVCVCVSHSLCVSLQLDQCGLPTLAFCPAPEGGAIPVTANQTEADMCISQLHRERYCGSQINMDILGRFQNNQ